ncbi:hypothetical protein ABIA99_005259 [Bradyrhizobium sp. LB12.1]|uniref:hypothetical protein n=1 Tax=Bradyrhizobium sp. LB12.1 TaxID=3156327 RepID=UPI00339800CB
MTSSARYVPRLQFERLDDRKEQFDKINRFISERLGWVTSIRGDPEVRFECVPGSTVPEDLRAAGHEVSKIGEGERILPAGMIERFVIGDDGEREPVTEGSTRPVQIVSHAGITQVETYCCRMNACDAAVDAVTSGKTAEDS